MGALWFGLSKARRDAPRPTSHNEVFTGVFSWSSSAHLGRPSLSSERQTQNHSPFRARPPPAVSFQADPGGRSPLPLGARCSAGVIRTRAVKTPPNGGKSIRRTSAGRADICCSAREQPMPSRRRGGSEISTSLHPPLQRVLTFQKKRPTIQDRPRSTDRRAKR